MTDAQALSELRKALSLAPGVAAQLRQVATAEAAKVRAKSRGCFEVGFLNRVMGQAEGFEDFVKLLLAESAA